MTRKFLKETMGDFRNGGDYKEVFTTRQRKGFLFYKKKKKIHATSFTGVSVYLVWIFIFALNNAESVWEGYCFQCFFENKVIINFTKIWRRKFCRVKHLSRRYFFSRFSFREFFREIMYWLVLQGTREFLFWKFSSHTVSCTVNE